MEFPWGEAAVRLPTLFHSALTGAEKIRKRQINRAELRRDLLIGLVSSNFSLCGLRKINCPEIVNLTENGTQCRVQAKRATVPVAVRSTAPAKVIPRS